MQLPFYYLNRQKGFKNYFDDCIPNFLTQNPLWSCPSSIRPCINVRTFLRGAQMSGNLIVISQISPNSLHKPFTFLNSWSYHSMWHETHWKMYVSLKWNFLRFRKMKVYFDNKISKDIFLFHGQCISVFTQFVANWEHLGYEIYLIYWSDSNLVCC